jgi:polygalacturonase
MNSNVMTPMKRNRVQVLLALGALALTGALVACGQNADPRKPFQVGTVAYDPDLPPAPVLPTPEQVCTTVYASDALVKRPDGALPPEADKTPATTTVGDPADPAIANPDQARIQAALNACAAQVNAEVGQAIAAADRAALEAQLATSAVKPLAGASGEELAKAPYRGTRFAVRLAKGSLRPEKPGPGDSFISGPLQLPSGVTLWIDEGVTLFATRDVMAFNLSRDRAGSKYCGNAAYKGAKGSSGNCWAFINGDNLVNSAVVGDGAIDSRGYAELVSSDPFYPLLKVDLTCTNTYAAWVTGTRAPNGTACDNGGTFVNKDTAARNMTWWDLAFYGNMVGNGRTGNASQSNFRMMVFNKVKNLTLYRITMNNSANFHFVPSGADGLTVWGVKLQTPSAAAYANPAGNQNPLYNGDVFNPDNVKNTDAFDPGAFKPSSTAGQLVAPLSLGWDPASYTSVVKTDWSMQFDGYLKNVVFAYNHVSTGDDDIVLKGSNHPYPNKTYPNPFSIDGNRDVRSDRKHGVVMAHNHIYWGHGISIGSETNSGISNVWVYDNSFEDSEEGLRIKSDYGRGGVVSNIHYENICIKNAQNALLFTPYYSTKELGAAPLVPDFHDLDLKNVRIIGKSAVKLMGFEANSGGVSLNGALIPQKPLVMSLDHVVADDPAGIRLLSSDAELTLNATNLPILPSPDARVNVYGSATRAVNPEDAVDCSRAFVPFPSLTSPHGTTW